MENNLFEFIISTKKSQEFVDITYRINESLKKTNITNGIAVIYCPHTTAGITINENADPDVVRDIITSLDKIFLNKFLFFNKKQFPEANHAFLNFYYKKCSKIAMTESIQFMNSITKLNKRKFCNLYKRLL